MRLIGFLEEVQVRCARKEPAENIHEIACAILASASLRERREASGRGICLGYCPGWVNAFLTHGLLLLLRVWLCRSKKHFSPPASQASRKGPGPLLLLSPAGWWCFLLPSTPFLTSFSQQLPLRKLEHVMKSTFWPFFLPFILASNRVPPLPELWRFVQPPGPGPSLHGEL